MHVVFRESHGLDETETPTDLDQDPADLLVLSFSDSDLGAFAAGWHRAQGGLPSLRLANLAALRHPLSVDTYVERTLAGAKGILIRLIGGVPYWDYGLQQVATLARTRGIALAVLPADGRADQRLDAASTLPASTLRRLAALCDEGGAVAAQAALAQLALAAGLYAGPVAGAKAVPEVGFWTPELGVCCPVALATDAPLVVVTFYRAYLTAADLGPVEALFAALRARGFAVAGLFARSLKAPEAAGWIARWVAALGPAAVVNTTAFSARDGGASPLDAGGVPVFQAALATSSEAAWAEAERGLSPADLAMHVVLPEVDGRIFAGVASFKEPGVRDPALQFARTGHRAHPGRVDAIADRVAAWVRLAALPAAARRVALVLSTYPGKPWQMAHAVGLDALASAEAILSDLAEAGHDVRDGPPLDAALGGAAEAARPGSGAVPCSTSGPGAPAAGWARHDPEPAPRASAGTGAIRQPTDEAEAAADLIRPSAEAAVAAGATPTLQDAVGAAAGRAPRPADAAADPPGRDGAAAFNADVVQAAAGCLKWPLAEYLAALTRLPERLRADLAAAWGAPEDDPACIDGAFRFAAVRRGAALVALQPERGTPQFRGDEYHDLRRVPRHGYVAFYLWLRGQADALVHVGAHGTLEWLPGKAVALSEACWPEALTGAMPVVYPFIVNDPGEAAQAKRRIGAVTLGHVPPPLRQGGTPERLARLEALLDEFSNADGLDPRRRDRLTADIRAEAQGAGVEADLGLAPGLDPAEAITRIDRFVCDVKESQFGDGLHVWGREPAAPSLPRDDGDAHLHAPARPAPEVRAETPAGRDLRSTPDVDGSDPSAGGHKARPSARAAADRGAGDPVRHARGEVFAVARREPDPPPGPDAVGAAASGGDAIAGQRPACDAAFWEEARGEVIGAVEQRGIDGVAGGRAGAAEPVTHEQAGRGGADDAASRENPPRGAVVAVDRRGPDIADAGGADGGRRGRRAAVAHVAGAVAAAARGTDAAGGAPDLAGSAAAERRALLDALAGRRIEPGPSGSPWRGRQDVLPTGRNLYTTDPRAVPTRAAHAQGVRLADELVRRHLQDHGDWPRGLIVDLWGSATMRTAGEEFAMALHLVGARPVWDDGSGRVSGVEILPIAELDRPRLDVTLRVSGLFRDVFPTLSALFGQAVRALAARDETAEWNPYAGGAEGARVYGPAPGSYGLALGAAAEDYTDAGRQAAGAAWLAASAWAIDAAGAEHDAAGIAARVAAADAFVHLQDLPETDLLLAADYAGHEAGFAAAKALTGGTAALWHLDSSDPARPRARALREEVARVVRARAANPAWIAGMRRHGFRGAAEIAATLDHLAAFAHLAGVVEPHLFDLYHDATLGDPKVEAFLADANPGALEAMRARFEALHAAGLWRTRRNSIAASLGGAS